MGPVRLAEPVFQALGYFLLWAASTFGALLVFRISMRRARIRPVHVGRCVVYSFDAALWGAVLLAAVGVATLAASYLLRARGFLGVAYIIVAIPYMLAAVVFYRLVSAYRHYLRFDRPFLTVLASQVIAWLMVVNVALW